MLAGHPPPSFIPLCSVLGQAHRTSHIGSVSPLLTSGKLRPSPRAACEGHTELNCWDPRPQHGGHLGQLNWQSSVAAGKTDDMDFVILPPL